jgi:hypothetical protein
MGASWDKFSGDFLAEDARFSYACIAADIDVAMFAQSGVDR